MSTDALTADTEPAAPTTAARGERRGAGTWAALRPLVLRLHFYAGVLVAPFLLVTALTGFLYALAPQAEKVVYADELQVPARPGSTPLAAQVDAAEATDPGGTLAAVRPAPSATDTTQVIFDVPALDESYQRTVYVDPHTAEVQGTLDTYGSSQSTPMRAWLSTLHRHLHLGDTGRLYSETAASWLWVVVLGGLGLWLGRRRASRRALVVPQTRPPGRGRVLSWHGTVGLTAAAGLLFLSATGLTWSTYAGENIAQLRSALAWETPAVATEVPGDGAGSGDASGAPGDVGPDRVLAAARAHDLDGPVEVALPAEPGQAYTVQQVRTQWPGHHDAVAVAPATGEVTDTVRFADHPLGAKLTRWGIDAHMGMLFGWVNQVLLAALALGTVCLVVWGYRMWWLRRPGRGPGRPPQRGAWRRLPARVLVPLVAVTAAVAYAVPVLGVTLVLFLAVDGLAALRRRAVAARTPG